MKKLKFLSLVLILTVAGFFFSIFFINGSKAHLVYGADECIKCYEDLGCKGGDVKCAGFECRGQPVICYTIQHQN